MAGTGSNEWRTEVSLIKRHAGNASAENSQRLFRTVTALGAELRRQGAFGPAEAKVDLIDLAYAAISATDGQFAARRSSPPSAE
jgi:hypothetical protein